MSSAVILKHELPSQRRQFRMTVPIDVEIGGNSYRTVNWSLLDFCIADYQEPRKRGDLVTVTVRVPYQGFTVAFEAEATVAVSNPLQRTLACEFVRLNERQREALETFVGGLVRGEMESVDGVLRRMDVPVTPASLKPDTPVSAEELNRQRRRREIGSLLYILAGVVFTLAFAVAMYANFFQIKVTSAVMQAPTDILLAPATGIVSRLEVAEREHAAKGQLLIGFSDPELEHTIERARLRLEEAGVIIADADRGAADGARALAAARAAVVTLRAKVEEQTAMTRRVETLAASGMARRSELAAARAQLGQTETSLREAQKSLARLMKQSAPKSLSSTFAEGEYQLLQAQRDRLRIAAPEGGSLLRFLTSQGALVRYGDPVAIFQHDEPKYVEAYLTREEALHVAKGDRATVHFPSQDYSASYRVNDVDYASQLVTRHDGRYMLGQAGQSRDVLVRLVVESNAPDAVIDAVVPGSQAVVIFDKKIFSR